MPQLSYTIGYVDLQGALPDLFMRIKGRTEIRRAEKSDVTIKIFHGNITDNIVEECLAILKPLLVREKVPYSSSFEQLFADNENIIFAAYRAGRIVSFILVLPKANNQFFKSAKTAFLGLSATNDEEKKYCPNYLLIWMAIEHLKSLGFAYFNLGLLTYINAPDPDLERVAFFKRRWAIGEVVEKEQASVFKYVYYRFFKRFGIVKSVLYSLKNIS